MNCITMYGVSPSVPESYTETIPGWFSRAAAWASRRKRSTKLASRANCGRSVLIATVRLRVRS